MTECPHCGQEMTCTKCGQEDATYHGCGTWTLCRDCNSRMHERYGNV